MLRFNTVIVILLVFTDNTSSEALNKILIPNNKHETKNYKTSKCISQITKEHISCKSVVFVVSSNNHDELLTRSINKYNCYLIITRSFAANRLAVYPDAYLISANSDTDFLNGFREISQDLNWNPTAKFVILFNDRVNNMAIIFQELTNFMVFNVVLLMNTKSDELEAFTYYLQSGGYCGRNASNIRSLGHCPNFYGTLFPNKVRKGFRNCTITVAVTEDLPYIMINNTEYAKYIQTGAEQYILNTIAEYEGLYLKYKYIKPDQNIGIILPNRNGTGLMGYLQRHETDIVAGGLFLARKRVEVFDCIYGYSFAMFSIFTPYLYEEKWTRVYKQFGVITWSLIILSFLVTVLAIYLTKTFTSENCTDMFLIMLKLWRYFYGQADNRLFKDKHIKRFLIVWIIFTSSINAFYNTASYRLITGDVKDKIKVNPKNLASLPFKPCISRTTRHYFVTVYNEFFPKNNDVDDLLCQNKDITFKSLATRNDLYAVDSDYTYYLRAINYVDTEGQPTIHKWDYPRTNILTMYCIKGFPLRNKFQQYALRIYETGLIQRHLSYIYSRKPISVPTLKRKFKVIRLKDFIIPYFILFSGVIISFICFLIEYKIGK